MSSYFHQKIGSVMKDNMYDREVGGFRSGKLDGKSLWKVPIGGDKVFSRRTERQNKKYNIVLLVDESGSMTNSMEMMSDWKERIEVASELCALLAKGLDRNNIDFCIVGFNGTIETHKEFNQRVGNGKEMIDQMKRRARGRYMACNHDLRAIQEAKRKLKGRSGKDIIIVFSDGQPNCDDRDCPEPGLHYMGANIDKLREELRTIPKDTSFISFGIGVDISDIYPNSTRVSNEKQFVDGCLTALSKEIKRG